MKVITFLGQAIVAYYAGLGVTPDPFSEAVAEDFDFGFLDVPVADSVEGLELVRVVHKVWIAGRPCDVRLETKPQCVLDVPAQIFCAGHQAVMGQPFARAYGLTEEDTARAFARAVWASPVASPAV